MPWLDIPSQGVIRSGRHIAKNLSRPYDYQNFQGLTHVFFAAQHRMV